MPTDRGVRSESIEFAYTLRTPRPLSILRVGAPQTVGYAQGRCLRPWGIFSVGTFHVWVRSGSVPADRGVRSGSLEFAYTLRAPRPLSMLRVGARRPWGTLRVARPCSTLRVGTSDRWVRSGSLDRGVRSGSVHSMSGYAQGRCLRPWGTLRVA